MQILHLGKLIKGKLVNRTYHVPCDSHVLPGSVLYSPQQTHVIKTVSYRRDMMLFLKLSACSTHTFLRVNSSQENELARLPFKPIYDMCQLQTVYTQMRTHVVWLLINHGLHNFLSTSKILQDFRPGLVVNSLSPSTVC